MNLSKTQRALVLALVIAAGGAGLAVAQTSPDSVGQLELPPLPALEEIALPELG